MSLILDALNKADKERQPSAPAPYTAFETIEPQKTKRKHTWQLFSIAALLFFCLLFLVLILLRDSSPRAITIPVDSTKPNPETRPSTANLNAHINVSETVKLNTNQAPTTELKKTPDLLTPYTNKAEKKQDTPINNEQISTQQALIAKQYEAVSKVALPSQKNTKIDSLYQQPVTEVAQTKKTTPNDIPSTMAQRYTVIGGIRSLPSSLQDQLPSLTYTEHNAKRQSVRINQKTLTVGSQITADLIVNEILSDSIILSFKGYKFKLGAYSSWVNM